MALSLVLVMLQMFLAALDGSAVRIGHAGPVRILGILSQSLFFSDNHNKLAVLQRPLCRSGLLSMLCLHFCFVPKWPKPLIFSPNYAINFI